MKRSLIASLGILILVSSLYAKQTPKQLYNTNQLEYRDIKIKIAENEQNLISNLRDIQAKKIDMISNNNNTIKKDFREKEELRRARKSFEREKLVRIVRYR
jgi:hypothetical protein